MEIRINRIGTQEIKDAAEVVNVYRVIQDGREFIITSRSYCHGYNLTLAGRKGFLCTDRNDNTVRLQVVAPGGGCALKIDDEPVEGLSPWALRGIAVADRNPQAKEIRITGECNQTDPKAPLLTMDGEDREI